MRYEFPLRWHCGFRLAVRDPRRGGLSQTSVFRHSDTQSEHDRPFRHGGQDECRSKSRMRWSIDTANQRNGDRSYPQEVGEPGESVDCRKEPYRIVLRHRWDPAIAATPITAPAQPTHREKMEVRRMTTAAPSTTMPLSAPETTYA
jgi:hypothetical protein